MLCFWVSKSPAFDQTCTKSPLWINLRVSIRADSLILIFKVNLPVITIELLTFKCYTQNIVSVLTPWSLKNSSVTWSSVKYIFLLTLILVIVEEMRPTSQPKMSIPTNIPKIATIRALVVKAQISPNLCVGQCGLQWVDTNEWLTQADLSLLHTHQRAVIMLYTNNMSPLPILLTFLLYQKKVNNQFLGVSHHSWTNAKWSSHTHKRRGYGPCRRHRGDSPVDVHPVTVQKSYPS